MEDNNFTNGDPCALPADETDGRAVAVADVLEAMGWTQRPSTGAGFGDG